MFECTPFRQSYFNSKVHNRLFTVNICQRRHTLDQTPVQINLQYRSMRQNISHQQSAHMNVPSRPKNCATFSRSYCYTVWSAIGIIMSSVRLSVKLCIVALRVAVEGQAFGHFSINKSINDPSIHPSMFIRRKYIKNVKKNHDDMQDRKVIRLL